jgi:hypothetical protein
MLELTKYISVALAATIKFFGGPLAGFAFKMSWWATAICSTVGLMLTVALVIYGGDLIKNLTAKFGSNKPKKIFTKMSRMAVKVKMKLGLWGIAFLTPLIFTPIVGSFLCLSFKFSKPQIMFRMLVCGLFWGSIQTLFLQYMKIIFFYIKDYFA